MRTTLDIDEDVLLKVRERADATGRSPGKIISEMVRRGFDAGTPDLPLLRDGLPQIRFDADFEPTSDSILDLIEKVEKDDDLGAPLIIPAETRAWIERTAAQQQTRPGMLASAIAQESLLAQGKWPARNGFPQVLRRSTGQRVVTSEFVHYLMDELG